MNPTFIYDVPIGTFTKEEKKILIELLCESQTHMIVKDNTKYESDKYKKLENLKVKIKDM
jgi:hypothetical protein